MTESLDLHGFSWETHQSESHSFRMESPECAAEFQIRNGHVAVIEHLRRLYALDASLRTIIAESSVHAPVNQRGGSLSTWNADTVEQTPLRAPAHRGVDGAFSHDRRAKTHLTGCLVCFAWTHASRTKGDREVLN